MLTWLAGRFVLRVSTLAAMLMLVGGIVLLDGIKNDAEHLRTVERIYSSSPRFASWHGGTLLTNGVSDGDVAQAKASLSGPRGAICRALGYCDGLTL
jgi:hypothetical protein